MPGTAASHTPPRGHQPLPSSLPPAPPGEIVVSSFLRFVVAVLRSLIKLPPGAGFVSGLESGSRSGSSLFIKDLNKTVSLPPASPAEIVVSSFLY